MINKYSILNETKYFYSGMLQNYFVFIPAKNALNILAALLEFIRGNLIGCQKKILKTQTNQTTILEQLLLIIMYY